MKIKTTTINGVLVGVVLTWFGFSQEAQAVLPPPDGGYPNFNTAEGQKALFSLTTGVGNTAVGSFPLFSATEASFNTATGVAALLFNTADQNTAIGAAALLNNTTGFGNTAVGFLALENNDTGSFNTATGIRALPNNTTGSSNTATGVGALLSNISGDSNTAIGEAAMQANSTGAENTAIGFGALLANNGGFGNTAVGYATLQSSTGDLNTALGVGAGFSVDTASDVTCIGANVPGADVSSTTWIGNVYNVTTQSATTLPVVVSNGGQLGTTPSSRRFKKDIQPMDHASEAILGLKPVTFQYKSDKTNTPQFGLVAEEVAEVNPDLVVPDKAGEIYTVRYDAVSAMLLNEFLKEHKRVQQLKSDFEATVAQQQEEIRALTAQLKEQATQIQKVNARQSNAVVQTASIDR